MILLFIYLLTALIFFALINCHDAILKLRSIIDRNDVREVSSEMLGHPGTLGGATGE